MRSLARLTTLFGAISSVAACAATARVSRDALTTDVCMVNAYEAVPNVQLAGLKPKVPVDYLELRGNVGRKSIGTACANATDATKCKKALEELAAPSVFPYARFD